MKWRWCVWNKLVPFPNGNDGQMILALLEVAHRQKRVMDMDLRVASRMTSGFEASIN